MRALFLIAVALVCAASSLGQGMINFYNHLADVTTRVYGPNLANPAFYQAGNGPGDLPVGSTDWTGYAGLSGTGYTAQLWYAPGADQPESSLQPVLPTTTFLTVSIAAGVLVNQGHVTLPGAGENTVATITLRVWDNQGGTLTSWAMAQAAGTALGESPLFNSPPLGLTAGPPLPDLVGLVSFNIHQVPEPSIFALALVGAITFGVLRLGDQP